MNDSAWQDCIRGIVLPLPQTSVFSVNSNFEPARLFPALLLVGALLIASLSASANEAVATRTFRGLCDASAGVDAGEGCFWVAGDEENVLRLFNPAGAAVAVRTLPLDAFLQVTAKSPEADLEGAARIGDTVYWITSHGCNKNGKFRENRHRFFATRIGGTGKESVLEPVGVAYQKLLADLTSAPALERYNLAEAATRAPKSKGALNIEALAARPDGSLWIGFRNPVPEGRALLVPLLNPSEVVRGARAELGDSLLLDLGGFGVRDMLFVNDGWLILAGPIDGGESSRLYHWRGAGTAGEQIKVAWPEKFNPEAVLPSSGDVSGSLLLLSDDGSLEVDGCPCKELPEVNQRRFRAIEISRP